MLSIKEGVEAVNGWFDSRFCAVTSTKGVVRLYSIAERSFVAEFQTIEDAGGISVAMSSDDRYCFLGTYYAWALACFEVSTGKLEWKRKDLARFYGLSFSAGQQALFGYFHGKSALKLNPSTGETVQSYRGIQEVYASPISGDTLLVDKKKLSLHGTDGKRLWSAQRESFAILEVAWSPGTVAISEALEDGLETGTSGIRCYGRHGELLWRYKGRKGHMSPLMYRPEDRCYIGVDFRAGPKDRLLVRWDEETGEIKNEQVIPSSRHGKLCAKGRTMCCVNYKTFETEMLAV
jgi:hypothetical protein